MRTERKEIMEEIKLNEEESLKFAEALLAPPRKLPAAFKDVWKRYKEEVLEIDEN